MIKIHRKFGNFFIIENNITIAMCTQTIIANRIRNALRLAEQLTNKQPLIEQIRQIISTENDSEKLKV